MSNILEKREMPAEFWCVCVGGGGGELEGEIPLETLRRGSKNILGLI